MAARRVRQGAHLLENIPHGQMQPEVSVLYAGGGCTEPDAQRRAADAVRAGRSGALPGAGARAAGAALGDWAGAARCQRAARVRADHQRGPPGAVSAGAGGQRVGRGEYIVGHVACRPLYGADAARWTGAPAAGAAGGGCGRRCRSARAGELCGDARPQRRRTGDVLRILCAGARARTIGDGGCGAIYRVHAVRGQRVAPGQDGIVRGDAPAAAAAAAARHRRAGPTRHHQVLAVSDAGRYGGATAGGLYHFDERALLRRLQSPPHHRQRSLAAVPFRTTRSRSTAVCTAG
eukprot:ctg_4322.g555